MNGRDEIIRHLVAKNRSYQDTYKNEFKTHEKGQTPQIAVLTCADSRVVPEHIFNAGIGELFVVRVAGNIAVDQTVLASLEYAVDHLAVSHLLILAHTHCGAVKAAEETKEADNVILSEIKESFSIDEDHVRANLYRQLDMIPKRSNVIHQALEMGAVKLIGAIYYLNNGQVEFLDDESLSSSYSVDPIPIPSANSIC